MAGKRRHSKIADDSGPPRDRPKKRAKPVHPHGVVDYEQEYKVRSIIGETKTKYHIDWEPNSDTGEVYTPTWEPKANANQLAVDDWEHKKAARSRPPAAPEPPVASSGDSARPVPKKKSAFKRSRARKVIESSHPAPEESATAPKQQLEAPAADAATEEAGNPPAASEPEPEPEPEIGESQQDHDSEVSIESPPFVSTREKPTRKGFVAPSSPPSSYRAGQYQKFGSQPANRNGVEFPHPAPFTAATTPSSSALLVLQSTPNEAEAEQAPLASSSVPGSSTQKSPTSLVIPESQDQGVSQAPGVSQDQGVPEESTFRGFSPTQRNEPRSPLHTGDVEAPEGDPNQLAIEASQPSQPRQTDCVSPTVERSSDCVSQAHSPVAAAASTTEPDEQASLPSNKSLGHSQVDLNTQSTEQVDSIAVTAVVPAQSTTLGHIQVGSNTQNTDQVDSVAQEQSALGHEVDLNTQSAEQVDSVADTAVVPAQSTLEHIQVGSDTQNTEQVDSVAQEQSALGHEVDLNTQSAEQVDSVADTAVVPAQSTLEHIQVGSDTQNTEQVDSVAQEQSALGHEVDLNTQSTEQVDSVADTAVFPAQSSLTAGSPPQDPGDRELIVISSTEHQSGQSASLNFESSVHEADYDPPPAGQRPLPSSAIRASSYHPVEHGASTQNDCPLPSSTIRANSDDPVGRAASTQNDSRICSLTGLTPSQGPPQPRDIHYYGRSQSSFPFQTQVPRPFTPQKIEPPAFSYTPGGRALFVPAQSPTRSPSVLSRRAPDSTPFPSIPSHSLAIGESAPRPVSVSPRARSTMDSSQERRETLAEKMKRIRDERVAKRQSATPLPSIASGQPASALPPNLIAEVAVAQAARLGSPLLLHRRSPSTVPAVEAVAPITREEMITSGRYETLLPQAHGGGSGEAESLQNGTSTSALSKSQDAIDDPESLQNGTSTSALSKSQDAIDDPESLQNGTGTSAMSKSQDAIDDPDSNLEDPETASVHVVPVAPSAHQRDQYQNNIYYDQALIGEVLTAQALEGDLLTRASKFLQGLRDVAMHPDLVNIETLSQTAESDIQARWDIKCSAKFCFLNELISNLSDQNLHMAVAAHGQRIPDMLHKFLEGVKVPCKRWARPLSIDPDLSPANLGLKVSIIDLDGGPQNVEPADVVVAMDPAIDTELPLIRAARKHARVEGTVKWAMLLVLVIPRTIEHVERCVEADMSHGIRTKVLVKATNELRWEAGRLESTQAPLVEAASAIADYMEDTSADWPIAGLSQLDELDSQTDTDVQPDSNKRPLDETQAADDNAAAKRARLSVAPTEATPFPGTINPLDLDITHISDSLPKGTQSAHAISSITSVSATEQRLRELLHGVQDRLDEHVRALEALQYRHEDQRKELVEVRKERDGAILTAQHAAARMTGAEANNAALRIERTELKEALADANRRLLGHTNPEVRELQEARGQAEQARAEQEKALKKAAAAEKDLDWTRSMYQDSSNRARELAQSNAELETRLTHATQVAQGQQARAREASYHGHNKLLEQENKKLKQMLENLKLAMRNKDEQISSLREGRGRIGTRQSSVPRSPRMGSPMKGGRLSRQTSPTASDARGRNGHLHPLRNSAGG